MSNMKNYYEDLELTREQLNKCAYELYETETKLKEAYKEIEQLKTRLERSAEHHTIFTKRINELEYQLVSTHEVLKRIDEYTLEGKNHEINLLLDTYFNRK